MNNYTMDNYTLQSYFKSLCNSFYIAYNQVKRLEKKEEELECSCPYEELELVENLLKISVSEELEQKYMASKYSREELEKKKEELELDKKEYDEKSKELTKPKRFWTNLLWKNVEKIAAILEIIDEKNFSIILTNKEEIVAFIAFFNSGYDVDDYRIINTDEIYLASFPAGEKMYEDFFAAYCLKDKEKMKEVYKKYF